MSNRCDDGGMKMSVLMIDCQGIGERSTLIIAIVRFIRLSKKSMSASCISAGCDASQHQLVMFINIGYQFYCCTYEESVKLDRLTIQQCRSNADEKTAMVVAIC